VVVVRQRAFGVVGRDRGEANPQPNSGLCVGRCRAGGSQKPVRTVSGRRDLIGPRGKSQESSRCARGAVGSRRGRRRRTTNGVRTQRQVATDSSDDWLFAEDPARKPGTRNNDNVRCAPINEKGALANREEDH